MARHPAKFTRKPRAPRAAPVVTPKAAAPKNTEDKPVEKEVVHNVHPLLLKKAVALNALPIGKPKVTTADNGVQVISTVNPVSLHQRNGHFKNVVFDERMLVELSDYEARTATKVPCFNVTFTKPQVTTTSSDFRGQMTKIQSFQVTVTNVSERTILVKANVPLSQDVSTKVLIRVPFDNADASFGMDPGEVRVLKFSCKNLEAAGLTLTDVTATNEVVIASIMLLNSQTLAGDFLAENELVNFSQAINIGSSVYYVSQDAPITGNLAQIDHFNIRTLDGVDNHTGVNPSFVIDNMLTQNQVAKVAHENKYYATTFGGLGFAMRQMTLNNEEYMVLCLVIDANLTDADYLIFRGATEYAAGGVALLEGNIFPTGWSIDSLAFKWNANVLAWCLWRQAAQDWIQPSSYQFTDARDWQHNACPISCYRFENATQALLDANPRDTDVTGILSESFPAEDQELKEWKI